MGSGGGDININYSVNTGGGVFFFSSHFLPRLSISSSLLCVLEAIFLNLT